MNGEVTVGLVAVGAALVLLVAFQFVWRKVVDERRSVQDYQHTLDTLRVVSSRNEPQRVRPVAMPHGASMGGPDAAQHRGTDVPEPGAGPGPEDEVPDQRDLQPVHHDPRPDGNGQQTRRHDQRISEPVAGGAGGDGAGREARPPRGPAVPTRVVAAATVASDEPTRMLARVRVPGEDPGDGGPGGGSVPVADGDSPPSLGADSTSASILIFDDVATSPVASPPARASTSATRGVAARGAVTGEPAAQWQAVPQAPTLASGASAGETERRIRSGQGSGRVMKVVTVAAAVLLVAAVATMIAALARPGHRVATGASSVGGTSHPPTGQPTGGSGGGRSSGARDGSTGRAPAPTTVQPTSATLYAATVAAPAAGYTVVVSATGNCWIEGQRTDTGQDVWSGTLAAGQQHRFSFAGPVVLRIGAANAAVSMNGEPVALPSGYQAPYNVTFQPS